MKVYKSKSQAKYPSTWFLSITQR